MSCREFFESLPTGPDSRKRASLISNERPDGCCEKESVSAHSAGKVEDAEHLFRFIFSPIHIEDDGRVNAAAFSDVQDKGLSCDRDATAEPSTAIHERGSAQVNTHNQDNPDKGPRKYLGVVGALCEDIRTLPYDDGSKAFAVYDTAKADNPSHADVFQITTKSPSQQKLLRKRLRDKFSQIPLAPPSNVEAT